MTPEGRYNYCYYIHWGGGLLRTGVVREERVSHPDFTVPEGFVCWTTYDVDARGWSAGRDWHGDLYYTENIAANQLYLYRQAFQVSLSDAMDTVYRYVNVFVARRDGRLSAIPSRKLKADWHKEGF